MGRKKVADQKVAGSVKGFSKPFFVKYIQGLTFAPAFKKQPDFLAR